jgi:hypothetical protein
LIDLDRLSAVYSVYELAEAVDPLMAGAGKDGKHCHDEEANQLSYRITSTVTALVAARPLPCGRGNNGRALLHSQSGIDVSAGTRILIGEGPEMFEYIKAVAPRHNLFPAGVSDISTPVGPIVETYTRWSISSRGLQKGQAGLHVQSCNDWFQSRDRISRPGNVTWISSTRLAPGMDARGLRPGKRRTRSND